MNRRPKPDANVCGMDYPGTSLRFAAVCTRTDVAGRGNGCRRVWELWEFWEAWGVDSAMNRRPRPDANVYIRPIPGHTEAAWRRDVRGYGLINALRAFFAICVYNYQIISLSTWCL